MRATVSRSHAEAAKDDEWPGRDLRNLKQSIIRLTETGFGIAAAACDTHTRNISASGEVGVKMAKTAKHAQVSDNSLTKTLCQRRLSRPWRQPPL